MAILEINKETCNQCNACVAACGSTIIVPHKNGIPSVYPGADRFCSRCGHCVSICPTASITHREMPLTECMPVKKELEVSFEQITHHIKSRRSIREFQNKVVPRGLIEEIIETARYAPTGHNLQEVQWLIIDDKEEISKITSIGLDWAQSLVAEKHPAARQMQGMIRMSKYGVDLFLRAAPVLVIVYAGKDNPMAPIDCSIALSYFDLAAQSAGLGSFWNGYFMMSAQTFPEMDTAMALPGGFTIYGALCVGYPMFKYQRIPPRKPANICFHGTDING